MSKRYTTFYPVRKMENLSFPDICSISSTLQGRFKSIDLQMLVNEEAKYSEKSCGSDFKKSDKIGFKKSDEIGFIR